MKWLFFQSVLEKHSQGSSPCEHQFHMEGLVSPRDSCFQNLYHRGTDPL